MLVRKNLILAFVMFGIVSYAQSDKLKQVTKGLRKATHYDMMRFGKEIMINDYDIYSLDGNLVSIDAYMSELAAGELGFDFYLDSNKEIKLVVMRPATELERFQMETMKNPRDDEAKWKGKDAPKFSVTTLDGKNWNNASLKGKVTVLNFWFIACKPCILEIPALNKLAKKYTDDDVVFLALGLDSKSDIYNFLETQKFEYQLVPNSEPITEDFRIGVFPAHIVIDPKGKVVLESMGFYPSTISNIEKSIQNQLQKE